MGTEETAHLLLDRRRIESAENVELALAPCERHPANPLAVDGRRAWTKKNLMVSLFLDQEAGRYRGWRYENVPRPGADDCGLAFPIESEDGLEWRTVGAPIPMGAVMYDASDPDPTRRYKMIRQGWCEQSEDGSLVRVLSKGEWSAERGRENPGLKQGIFSACSPDGATWPEYRAVVIEDLPDGQRWWRPGMPGWAGGDSFPCVLWAPELRKYVAFFRTNIDRGQKSRRERGVGRSESEDFRNWDGHELSLHARTTWRKAMGHGAQDYYQLQAWRCRGIYLGIVSVFYWEQDRVRLELAWSPDTRHWERICPGVDLIPHGELGEHDGGCRYAAMRPIAVGDETRVYYGADPGRHNADPDREGGLCLATFRRDRFAGMVTKGSGAGTVTTVPVEITGDRLFINADASGGAVRVEVLSADGRTIPGFAAEQAIPVDSDSLDAEATCRGSDLRTLNGRTARLRFQLTNARLYAYGFRNGCRGTGGG